MALSFRQRILGILILLGAVPTTALVIGWAITLRATDPAGATRTALEEVGVSGRRLLETVDTTRLTETERRAVDQHVEELNRALGRTQRAVVYTRSYAAGIAVVILVLGGILVYASVNLAGHLSRQLSRPIQELVGWTERLRNREPLPAGPPIKGAPEFAALRTALRDMAEDLERGRHQELEAERLRAFREVARRVAHEMKNPLTPMRFAVAQLRNGQHPEQAEALEVLIAESARLEELARAFTELGRLPQGPAAPVDLHELVTQLTAASLPGQMRVALELAPGPAIVTGYYDPLRRALGNIFQNAVEATGGAGRLTVRTRVVDGAIELAVEDDGPGFPAELGQRVFDPYVTGKTEGTGLGLALAQQTVRQHGGTILIGGGPGGGAVVTLTLPLASPATG